MLFAPHLLIGAFLDVNDPKNALVVDLARSFLVLAAIFQLADGAQAVGAGMLRGLAGHPRADDLCGLRLLGRSGCRSASSWPSARACAASASGSASPAAWRWWPALMLWRWLRRDRLGLVTAMPRDVQEAFAA